MMYREIIAVVNVVGIAVSRLYQIQYLSGNAGAFPELANFTPSTFNERMTLKSL
jgi:hypothetical protein